MDTEQPSASVEGLGLHEVPLTPLAIVAPPKPIGKMTDDERHAFAARIFGAIAATRRPSRRSRQ